MYVTTALLAAFVFFYSVFSGKLEPTPFSGAIVYTTFGLVFGSFGFGLLDLDVGSESLSALAEFTLALVLFTDAANTDFKVLRHSYRIFQRLLLIGLPLTILAGFGTDVFLLTELTQEIVQNRTQV